jgi:hypothetical protein
LHQDPKLTIRVDKLNLMVIEQRRGLFDPFGNPTEVWRSATFHYLLDVATVKKVTAFPV